MSLVGVWDDTSEGGIGLNYKGTGTYLRNEYVRNDGSEGQYNTLDGGEIVALNLPKYDHTNTALHESTLSGIEAGAIEEAKITYPGLRAYLTDDMSLDDQGEILDQYVLYHKKGKHHANDNIINEDLYTDYDGSYASLGKLYAYDYATPGYLGYDDTKQAENYIEVLLAGLEPGDVLDDSEWAILSEWGVVEPDEFWVNDAKNDLDLANNSDLLHKIGYRSSAYLQGVLDPENTTYMTDIEYNEHLSRERQNAIVIAEGITGSTIANDLKVDSDAAYDYLFNGIAHKEGQEDSKLILHGTTGSLNLYDESDKKTLANKLVNYQDTFKFIIGLDTGGAGYLDNYINDLDPKGSVIKGSKLEKTIQGLKTIGLEGAGNNLVKAVYKQSQYDALKSSTFSYIENSVDNPEILESRHLLVNAFDKVIVNIEDTAGATFISKHPQFEDMSPRDIYMMGIGPLLYANPDDPTAKALGRDLLILLNSDAVWAAVPTEHKLAWFDLIEDQAILYGGLDAMNTNNSTGY